jgi:hypothetical protein
MWSSITRCGPASGYSTPVSAELAPANHHGFSVEHKTASRLRDLWTLLLWTTLRFASPASFPAVLSFSTKYNSPNKLNTARYIFRSRWSKLELLLRTRVS